MTLIFELDLNQHAKYLGQRLFHSEVIVWIHKHTRQSECFTWTTKVVDNNWIAWPFL